MFGWITFQVNYDLTSVIRGGGMGLSSVWPQKRKVIVYQLKTNYIKR